MTAIWFTADTHFGHAKVAEIRGFSTTEEHDDELVRRWNRVVKPGDTVWHLGDVYLGDADRALENIELLNGNKHLIAGNHDGVWSGHVGAHKLQIKWSFYFRSIQSFARLKWDKKNVLMSHFPYAGDHREEERYSQFRLKDEGLWLLHGHVHTAWKLKDRQINVGVDAWDLAPVDGNELRKLIKEEME